MNLVVIACRGSRRVSVQGVWTLRLDGVPRDDEIGPPGLLEMADEAAASVRDNFPHWLWDWINRTGVLALEKWPGPVSWWWYTPLSERSPQRSPIIRRLYWLTLFNTVLKKHNIQKILWQGEDPVVAAVARSIADQLGLDFQHVSVRGVCFPVLHALAQRVRFFVRHVLNWLALNFLARVMDKGPKAPQFVLFSRFPVLWETKSEQWVERMFGGWPAYLRSKGHTIEYACASSASVPQLLKGWKTWRTALQDQDITFLETNVSFLGLLAAHFPLRLFWRYLLWRIRRRRERIVYQRWDITELVNRELNVNVLSSEIPFDLVLASGMGSLLKSRPQVRAVFLPFEYQPMERAIWAGCNTSSKVHLIGFQTSLFVANNMGYRFPKTEIRQQPEDWEKSPVPNVLAAYGELSYRVFSDQWGKDRVCWSGPLRYTALVNSRSSDAVEFRRDNGLPEKALFIAVTTSSTRDDSIPLLAAAFQLAAELPDAFLLIKFHYHLPLFREVEGLAERHQCRRFQIFQSNLHDMLKLSPILLTGASSCGIEAMLLGCMPLVYHSPVDMLPDPMRDVGKAVFYWTNLDEVRQAVRSCMERDAEFVKRRSEWEWAIQEQLSPLDNQTNARLYQFLFGA